MEKLAVDSAEVENDLQLHSIADLEEMASLSADNAPPARTELPASVIPNGRSEAKSLSMANKGDLGYVGAKQAAEYPTSHESYGREDDATSDGKASFNRIADCGLSVEAPRRFFSSRRFALEPLDGTAVIQRLTRMINEVTNFEELSVKPHEGPDEERILFHILQVAAYSRSPLLLKNDKRVSLGNVVEKAISDGLKQLFGFWLSKFVHLHGRVDFGGGLVRSDDILVFRSALFVTTVIGRTPHTVPVFYFPDDETAAILSETLTKSWSLVGGPVNLHKAKLRYVPLSADGETMDTTSLLTIMDEDISCGRKPCLLHCRAGTLRAGQVDELRKLREICDQYNCWMHVEGDQLYGLMSSTLSKSSAIRPVPSLIDSARLADSVTINLNGTFGLSEDVLPSVTFFQNFDPRFEDSLLTFRFNHDEDTPGSPCVLATLGLPTATSLELTLPVWVALNNDLNRMKVFYARARELAQAMTSKALMMSCMAPLSGTDKVYFVSSVRFSPSLSHSDSVGEGDRRGDYLPSSQDALNLKSVSNLGTKYIFDNLPTEVKAGLAVSLVTINAYSYIRYAPLGSDTPLEAQAELLMSAISFFESQSKICESTLKLQPLLKSTVENGSNELTYIENFVIPSDSQPSSQSQPYKSQIALGAVRYTPSFIESETGNVSEEVLLDLDDLNKRLADQLAETYGSGLFYHGEVMRVEEQVEVDATRKASVCIVIGMDKRPFTLDAIKILVGQIYKLGREMENGPEFVDNISAVVRKGIERAEKELKSEMSDEVLVFRSLPVIGTVLSIIGVPPPQKNSQKVRPHRPFARTFTISSGFSTVPLASAPQPGRMSISMTRDNLDKLPGTLERRASEGHVPQNVSFLEGLQPSVRSEVIEEVEEISQSALVDG
ncbi:Pyridoxal-dependent decarboxylase domain-containing protein 1 [Dinochytrium kinnereticum]|nr:Pyridoxal-dependent decarboxylase domain-containing protein 1 [Dinochytrium kinnereticum]